MDCLYLLIAAQYPQEQSDRSATKAQACMGGPQWAQMVARGGQAGGSGQKDQGMVDATLPSLSVNKSAQAGISCRKLLPLAPPPCLHIPSRMVRPGEPGTAPQTYRTSAPTSSALGPAVTAE